MYYTKVTTPPTVEPVTVAEAKTHLRIDHSSHDTYIGELIQAAREYIERLTGRAFVQQTRSVFYSDWPDSDVLEIPYPPLQSVTWVHYTDTNGDSNTLSTDDYSTDTDTEPGRVVLAYGESWPTTTIHTPEYPIEIRYVCGYESTGEGEDIDYTANIPEAIKIAIKLYTELLYDRPPEDYSKRLEGVIKSLIAPYTVWGHVK